jgi:hypothetical protein
MLKSQDLSRFSAAQLEQAVENLPPFSLPHVNTQDIRNTTVAHALDTLSEY